MSAGQRLVSCTEYIQCIIIMRDIMICVCTEYVYRYSVLRTIPNIWIWCTKYEMKKAG